MSILRVLSVMYSEYQSPSFLVCWIMRPGAGYICSCNAVFIAGLLKDVVFLVFR